MTSTEFVKWVRFLDWRDTEEFRREDYYLAQIAAQIERGQVKTPSQVTIQRKMLKFTTREPPQDAKKDIQHSKSFWLALTRTGKGRKSQKNAAAPSPGLATQGPEEENQMRGKIGGEGGM